MIQSPRAVRFVVQIAVIGGLVLPTAQGQTISWINAAGGEYRTPTSWSAGAVPGSGNDALFALASPYTVTFGVQNEAIQRATFRDGEVTLDLSGRVYSLNFNFDFPAPSLTVGDAANKTGKLNVLNGRLDARQFVIAKAAHGGGRLTVESGGTMRHNSTAHVGYEGDGIVNILSGGVITRYGANDLGNLFLGSLAGGTGVVNIDGTGSHWNLPRGGQPIVGAGGTGLLNITGGGSMVSYAGLTVGQIGGSDGEVVIAGAGSMFHNEPDPSNGGLAGSIHVGARSTGRLSVSAGGSIDGYQDSLGTYRLDVRGGGGPPTPFRGSGTATITGAGSTWTNRLSLIVGQDGDGDLTISAGALVDSGTEGLSHSAIAAYPGSTGNVIVTGAGSLWRIRDHLDVGMYYGSVGGTGTLTVTNSGSVEVKHLHLGSGATVTADSITIGTLNRPRAGGGLFIESLDAHPNADITAGEVFISPGGSLAGLPVITADLTNSGALGPDGDFHVMGDFTQTALGELGITLGMPTYDRLLVDGAAHLGGTLRLDLAPGYTPGLGDRFDIVLADSVSGRFAAVVAPPLVRGDGLSFHVSYFDDAVRVSVVPAPGTWMAVGLMGWVAVVQPRRRMV